MGRPRMIIIIRHAQSEGNRNRAIHQTVPDHRVKLTWEGQSQAEEAGHRLRSMLRPDDTIQFYTSPYRRTRETTEGILRSLTSDEPSPSPFPRHTIKIWEEPRLREQDFGNFQPCSSAMERMWQERADYGHFFYRIPNGESAADAYDRVSGFNETLWRSFGDDDFPSVCVLVTHGLMTRVFLMKWYHWSVEYFEDLRNINHCEFVVMQSSGDRGKFVLQNELRTWSELKKREKVKEEQAQTQSPDEPKKQWGGCPEGCTHDHDGYPTRQARKSTQEQNAPQPRRESKADSSERQSQQQTIAQPVPLIPSKFLKGRRAPFEEEEEAFPRAHPQQADPIRQQLHNAQLRPQPAWMHSGRDFGGSRSGAATPVAAGSSDDEQEQEHALRTVNTAQRKEWAEDSGMQTGARADALGDQSTDDDNGDDHGDGENDERESMDVDQAKARDQSVRGSVY